MSPNRPEPDENDPVVGSRGAPTRVGRYELLERVGRGSLGALYRGRDSVLGREVAVKVMAPGLLGDGTAHARFFSEARAAARLQHVNIVTIFEFGEHERTPYIVMEFLRGNNLDERMRKEPPLSLPQKLDIAIQICAGLEAAHTQDVVHRDIKPRNIWICEDGTVKLLDFAIATAATTSGTFDLLASPSYMSPEQITSKEVDRRTDIYSSGAVLYELISGRRPFEADSPAGVMLKIVNESAPPLDGVETPSTLAASVARAMDKSPAARYSRASEFGRELRTIKADLPQPSDAATLLIDRTMLQIPVHSPEVGPVHPDGPPASVIIPPRGLPAAVTVAVGGIILAIVTLAVIWLMRPTSPPMPAAAPPVAPGPSSTDPAAAAPPPAIPPAVPPAPVTTVTVRFESQPAAAKILIEGRDTGQTTPAEIPIERSQLPARVQFQLPGFRTAEASLTSEVAGTGVVSVSLSPRETAARGRLVGTGEYPYELLDRQRVISATSDRHDVAVSGLQSLRLRADRYFLDQNIRVNLGDGAIVQVSAPPLGTVTIAAVGALAECRVLINGRLVDGGSLPVSNRAIASGVHRVRLSCSNGDTEPQSVVVLPRQSSALRFAADTPVIPR